MMNKTNGIAQLLYFKREKNIFNNIKLVNKWIKYKLQEIRSSKATCDKLWLKFK